jgi:hypothetical protein
MQYNNLDTECEIFQMVEDDLMRKKFQSNHFVMRKGDKLYTSKFDLKFSITIAKTSPMVMKSLRDRRAKLVADGYDVINTNI